MTEGMYRGGEERAGGRAVEARTASPRDSFVKTPSDRPQIRDTFVKEGVSYAQEDSLKYLLNS